MNERQLTHNRHSIIGPLTSSGCPSSVLCIPHTAAAMASHGLSAFTGPHDASEKENTNTAEGRNASEDFPRPPLPLPQPPLNQGPTPSASADHTLDQVPTDLAHPDAPPLEEQDQGPAVDEVLPEQDAAPPPPPPPSTWLLDVYRLVAPRPVPWVEHRITDMRPATPALDVDFSAPPGSEGLSEEGTKALLAATITGLRTQPGMVRPSFFWFIYRLPISLRCTDDFELLFCFVCWEISMAPSVLVVGISCSHLSPTHHLPPLPPRPPHSAPVPALSGPLRQRHDHERHDGQEPRHRRLVPRPLPRRPGGATAQRDSTPERHGQEAQGHGLPGADGSACAGPRMCVSMRSLYHRNIAFHVLFRRIRVPIVGLIEPETK